MRLRIYLIIASLSYAFHSFALTQNQPLHHSAGNTLTIHAPEGSYVSAEIVAGYGVKAWLLDENGEACRQFSLRPDSQSPVHFVAAYNNPVIRYSGDTPRFNIKRIVSIEEQQSYKRPPQSKIMGRAVAALDAGGDVDQVWAGLIENGTPLMEAVGDNVLLTFIYRGAKQNVLLFGAPDNDHGWLDRLSSSDIWYKSYLVPEDTRLAYQLAPDVPQFAGERYEQRVALLAKVQRDPNNPNVWPDAQDKYQQESTVELTKAPLQPGVKQFDSHLSPSYSFVLDSKQLNNRRNIKVFQIGDIQQDSAIQLLIFDGPAYIKKVSLPDILNNLVSAGELPPVEAIFIDNLDGQTRSNELPDNRAFTGMLVQELIPYVEKKSQRQFIPKQRVLAGSSYGGLGATNHALRRSDIFGNVISMSGSYWWSADSDPMAAQTYYVSENIMRTERLPVRFFISAGLFEGGRNGEKGILDGSRHLRDILKLKGYDVSYREYAGGHDYFVWRGALTEGLMALFPVTRN